MRVTGPQCVTGTRSAALKGTLTGNPPIPHLKRNLLFEKLAQKKPIQACKFRFLEQEIADPPVEAHSATGLTLLLILRCGHTSRFAHTCPLISFRITPCCCVLYRCSDLRSSQLLLDYAWAFASAHFASFPRVTACLRPGCMSQA